MTTFLITVAVFALIALMARLYQRHRKTPEVAIPFCPCLLRNGDHYFEKFVFRQSGDIEPVAVFTEQRAFAFVFTTEQIFDLYFGELRYKYSGIEKEEIHTESIDIQPRNRSGN